MKTVETRIAEAIVAVKNHKGFRFDEVLKEIADKPAEQKLHILEALLKSRGAKKDENGDWKLKESTRKNNGADTHNSFLFDESNWTPVVADGLLGESDEIRQTAKDMRVSLREATIFITGKDPGAGPKAKETGVIIASRGTALQETTRGDAAELREAWQPMKGLLSDREIEDLVAKGIRP
jgi:hypothetical protein